MKILRSDVTKMATQTVPDFAFLHKKPKEQLLKKNQDVTERTLEHKVKREALSCTRDPREGLRKAATLWLHCPPRGHCSLMGDISPDPLASPVGKENSELWADLWEPLLWSHTMGTAGESAELNHHRNETATERGEGLQHTNPGRLNSHLQWPSSNPNQWLCSSAEPNWGHTLTREHRWAQIGLIHLLKWGLLPALGPSLPCPNKKLNHSTIHWRVSSSRIWPEWLITPERHVAQ